MLTQQVQKTMFPAASPPLVQAGPVYACPVCGQPVLGLVPWPMNHANLCKLDEWAAHIWYLRRRCGCRTGGRVARLGDQITPLEFSYDASLSYEQQVRANITVLRAALALLALSVPGSVAEQQYQLRQPSIGGGNGHRT